MAAGAVDTVAEPELAAKTHPYSLLTKQTTPTASTDERCGRASGPSDLASGTWHLAPVRAEAERT